MRSKVIGFALSLVAILAIYSCTHVSGTYVSKNGSMAGSSMKGNCMDCHLTGATEGGFSVGGTAFQTDGITKNTNGIVELHSLPNGKNSVDTAGNITYDKVVATIEVDGVGNFYTTHPIDFSQGLYPKVFNSSRSDSAMMQNSTGSGACNSCHGISQGVITLH